MEIKQVILLTIGVTKIKCRRIILTKEMNGIYNENTDERK
jgi:DNA-directed RNA polymerase subunit N (RpoN/RPB10)